VRVRWLLVTGCWSLVAGHWLLVTGCWSLVAGGLWDSLRSLTAPRQHRSTVEAVTGTCWRRDVPRPDRRGNHPYERGQSTRESVDPRPDRHLHGSNRSSHPALPLPALPLPALPLPALPHSRGATRGSRGRPSFYIGSFYIGSIVSRSCPRLRRIPRTINHELSTSCYGTTGSVIAAASGPAVTRSTYAPAERSGSVKDRTCTPLRRRASSRVATRRPVTS